MREEQMAAAWEKHKRSLGLLLSTTDSALWERLKFNFQQGYIHGYRRGYDDRADGWDGGVTKEFMSDAER